MRWMLDIGVADGSQLVFEFYTEEERSEFSSLVNNGRNLVDVLRNRQQAFLEDLVATMRRDALPEPPPYAELPRHGSVPVVIEDELLPELIDHFRLVYPISLVC